MQRGGGKPWAAAAAPSAVTESMQAALCVLRFACCTAGPVVPGACWPCMLRLPGPSPRLLPRLPLLSLPARLQGSLDDLSHVLASRGTHALEGATEVAAAGLALPAVPKWRSGASPGWPGSPRSSMDISWPGSPRSAAGGWLGSQGSTSGNTTVRPSFEDGTDAGK